MGYSNKRHPSPTKPCWNSNDTSFELLAEQRTKQAQNAPLNGIKRDNLSRFRTKCCENVALNQENVTRVQANYRQITGKLQALNGKIKVQDGSSILHNAFSVSVFSLVVSVLVYRSLAAISHVEGVMPPAAFTGGTIVYVIRLA